MKLSKNKIILILTVLVLIMAIMNVSATDTDNITNSDNLKVSHDSTDIVSCDDETNNQLQSSIVNTTQESVETDNIISSSPDNIVLANDKSDNILSDDEWSSFSDLQSIIDASSSGSTISLDKNYIWDSSYIRTTGITINKALTINGNGFTISGANQSRIFTISAGVNINNVTFTNFNYTSEASALYTSGAYINVYNSTFKDSNSSTIIITSSSSQFLLDNCIFKNIYLENNGIWLYYRNRIYNCQFENITFKENSGQLIRYYNATGYIINTTFTNINMNNKSNVCFGNFGNYNYINCTFTNNNAEEMISVDPHVYSSLFNITDCKFIDNIGRAITIGTNCNGVISGSTFINNSAEDKGGAIYLSGSHTVTLSNSTFINNTAGQYGGAIFYFKNSNVNLTNLVYSGNVAGISGNDAYELNENETVLYVGPNGTGSGRNISDLADFSYAYDHIANGGTIYFTSNNYTFTKTFIFKKTLHLIGLGNVNLDMQRHRFELNQIPNSSISNIIFRNAYGYQGGMLEIMTNSHNATIINCTFINCTNLEGFHGGAIYLASNVQNISIIGCTFINNRGYVNGGAIVANNNPNLVISNCTFINNTAGSGSGGAIYFNGQGGNISDSIFINNKAATNGGAIYWASAGGYLNNSVFTNNIAESSGGAIYWNGANGVLTYSNFTNNSAINSNDIYSSSNTFQCDYNLFNGSYLYMMDTIVIGYSDAYISITPSQYNVNVTVTIDNVDNNFTIQANKTGNTFINISSYFNTVESKNISLKFTTDGTNQYYSFDRIITVVDSYTIFISPDGNSTGETSDNPTNWTYAYSNIPSGGTIIMKNGTYNDIIGKTIAKTITIRGSGDTVIDPLFKGGVFTVSALNVKISCVTFKHASNIVISARGDNLFITNCTFSDNEVSTGQCQCINGYNNINITNCIFTGNKAAWGGMIFINNNVGTTTITDSLFINNEATAATIGYFLNRLILSNSRIINNIATNGESAGCNIHGNDSVVRNCIFDNNSALNGQNVAIIAYHTTGNNVYVFGVYNSTFSNNRASTSGGAVTTFFKTTIEDCNFINNTAAGTTGGALEFNNNGFNTVKNTVFINNSANNNAGAIKFNNGANSNVINCTFIGNTAMGNGGAIYWNNGANGSISNCTFNENNATTGGAVYWNNGANSTLTDSKFNYNTAVTSNDIYIKNGLLSCDNNIFTGVYSDIPDTVVVGYASFSIGITPAQYDVNVTVNINNKNKTFTVKANTTGNTLFDLSDIISDVGTYDVNFSFTTTGTNTYICDSVHIVVIAESIIYISPNGTGNGTTQTNPSNWTYANDNIIVGGTIIFLGGNYTNITGKIISKSMTIKTLNDKVIVDANGTSDGIFIINANNVIINGLSFVNSNGTSAIVWNGLKGIVTNSTFVNNSATNGACIYWYGDYGTVTYSNFTKNVATTDSGAICWVGANATIMYSNFNYNNQTQYAVLLNTIDSHVLYCNFTGNLATTYSTGALRVNGANSSVVGSRFINNTATQSAGAIWWYAGDNGIISDCYFEGNVAREGVGGAINWRAGVNGTIINCNFTDNHAQQHNGGGAIYWSGGNNATIIYCNFNNNYATRNNNHVYGGALYLSGPSYANISYCSFDNNHVYHNVTNHDANGGAVYWNSVNSTISYCNFTNNYAINVVTGRTIYGGGVDAVKRVNISYCNFQNNYGNALNNVYGSALRVNAVGSFVEYCNFTDNRAVNATAYSGTLYIGGNNITVDNCYFARNNGTVRGGAISRNNDYGVISNCVFINNTATTVNSGEGGAIYVYSGTSGSIINCNFTNNKAYCNGGAINFRTGINNYTVAYCIFNNNSAIRTNNVPYGGAIRWIGIYGNLSYCSFNNNSAKHDTTNHDVYGGAVHFNSIGGFMSYCNFTDNWVYNSKNSRTNYGGALYVYNTNTTVSYCNFNHNYGAFLGSGNVYGIAVYIRTNYCVVEYCNFTNNYCINTTNGGSALFWAGTYGILKESNFIANNATSHGGAARFESGNNAKIINCNFTNNKANSFAGALQLQNSQNIILSGSTFSNNVGVHGGAIRAYNPNNVTIDKCKFYNNSATSQGSAISTNNVITISNSDFFDNKVKSTNLIVDTTSNKNITVTLVGADNYLNAIWSDVDLSFSNVNYWGVNGRMNTDRNGYIKSSNEAGQNITLNLTGVGGNIYLKSLLTDSEGVAVFTGMVGDTYSGSVYHPENTYYTYINESISDWAVGGTFTQLNELIQSSTNGVVNLSSNYIYDSLTDSAFKNGITISEDSLTINGNGFTIDASNLARIFNINADNVVLNNLTLINGYANMGGAVLWNGTSGSINRSKFYNNTAKNNGSAIYTTGDLNIYDSEFLDNVARIYLTSTLSVDGTAADIHFVSGDNYINAIYSTASISGSNVTYWNSTDKVSIDTGFDTTKDNQKLDMEVLYKLNQTSYGNVTNVTDSSSNITITNLTPIEYYSVVVKQSRGNSKYASDVVDVASNITVTPMELIVSSVVYVGDNLTVIALLADDATGGNITFSANGTFIANVSVVNGRGSLSINPNLAPGVYELVGLYSGDGKYYGQRNASSSFVVRFSTPPIVTVVVSNLSVINTNLTIRAFSNLNLTKEAQILSGLQLVVLTGT